MSDTTHFGFKNVPTTQKQVLVKEVFDSVATKYDVMNDLMSFGIHRLWKDYVITQSEVKNGDSVLDIAGGTGDLARQFRDKIGNNGMVILADINHAMLTVGRDNNINKGYSDIAVVQTNAESLCFMNNSFDIISIAFGLRNITHKEQALKEFFRVLKPEGILLILEFSKLENDALQQLYDSYSFNVLPAIGKIVANDSHSYKYLAESIRKHPNQQVLQQMVLDSGFNACEYHNLSGGIVALHKAIK